MTIPKPDSKTLSNIRKYSLEYMLLILVFTVAYLFTIIMKNQDTLKDMNEKQTAVIERNTLVIQNFNHK